MIRRIILRHLAFAGKNVEPAVLAFEDGMNVVYGASNTGKSFAAEAIDFMLGAGDPLPEDVEQLADYQDVLLGLALPTLGEVTLCRGVVGGNFELFEGLHKSKPTDAKPRKLSAKHSSKNRDASLSSLLLDLLGFETIEVVKKSTTGEKISFSFRGVAPFALVKEGAMLSTNGPVFSNDRQEPAEQNIFKALLTGIDDSAVVAMTDPKISRALLSGKVEFVDELIARIEDDLGTEVPTEADLNDQRDRLNNELSGLEGRLRERQNEVDRLAAKRRSIQDEIERETREIGERRLSIVRFNELNQVYETDLRRLASIEEGGVVLLAMAGRPCPFCGADPQHQHHDHGVAEAQATYQAAKLEMAKIVRDQTLLATTTQSVGAEIGKKMSRLESLHGDLQACESMLESARPSETGLRSTYDTLSVARRGVQGRIELLQEKARLSIRRESLISEARAAPKSLKLAIGPSGPVGHELAQSIQNVLHEWGYPGNVTVAFDLDALDIRVDGKIRTANGKGVRALLHAAFNVGLLIFCRQKELPHPGFLILDTPLLTYREPEKHTKHGAIQDDEKVLRASGLRHKFFEHLHSLKDAQFLILENVDPPADVPITRTFFSGELGNGRFGLFPPEPARR